MRSKVLEPFVTREIPAPKPNPVTVARSVRANAVKAKGRYSPEAVEAARNLAAAKLTRHVQEVVDAAPPLTTLQKEAIIRLLAPSQFTNK
jgi:hypothetical protein